MRCPYCAEEIKDEAIFCRYCAHDLSYFKRVESLLEKIASLEEEVSKIKGSSEVPEAEAEGQAVSDKAPANSSPAMPKILRMPPVISALLCALFSVVSFELLVLAHSYNQILQIVLFVVVVPFFALPFGILAGIARPERHSRTYYSLLGLSAGLVTLLVIVWQIIHPSRIELAGWMVLGFYPIGGALLFTAGGLFGEMIRKRRASSNGQRQPGVLRGQLDAARELILDKDPKKRRERILELLPSIITAFVGLTNSVLLFVAKGLWGV